MTNLTKLRKEIMTCQEELNNMLGTGEETGGQKVLELSRKLDELIMQFYRISKQNFNNSI